MTTWNTQSRNTSSFTTQSRNTTTFSTQPRPGTVQGGWTFNQLLLEFNSVDDPLGNDQVMFNGVGVASSWATEAKS